MTQTSVLLDTSFFIRLLNPEEKLHKNALNKDGESPAKNTKTEITKISIKREMFRFPKKRRLKNDVIFLKSIRCIPESARM